MKTKDPKAQCIHAGHRKRLRTTIHKVGLENMSDINILEFILTLCIPRGDTNEIAHRLLSEFGSVSAVLDANPQALLAVEGVGDTTSEILTLIPQIANFYIKDKASHTVILSDLNSLGLFAKSLFIGDVKEKVFLIFLKKDKITVSGCSLVGEGDYSSVKFNIAELSNSLSAYNSNSVIIVHNHPHGNAAPSKADVDSTNRLTVFFKGFGIDFIDSIIVSDKEFFSFNANSLLEYKEPKGDNR